MPLKEGQEPARKGSVYLRPSIWEEIAALADFNGREQAEEVRNCILEGLRASQERIRRATGTTPGYQEDEQVRVDS